MGGLYDDFGFNGKPVENNIVQGVAYWGVQWESILGVPWEINGVHIGIGVNNIKLNDP